MRAQVVVRAIAVSFILVLPVNSQTDILRIDTTPLDPSGPGPLGTPGPPFPIPPFSALGQTFTTESTSTILHEFTFWLDDCSDYYGVEYRPLTFKAVVREWRLGTLGPILYESSAHTTTNNHGHGGFEQFIFFPENLLLEPNTRYVAYLTTSDFINGDFTCASMPYGQTPYGNPILGGGDTAGRWVSKYPDQAYWREEVTIPFNDVAFKVNTDQPLYNVCLLYDPTKAVKAGSTIPIKLQLCDSDGNNLSSPSVIVQATSVTLVSDSIYISGLVQDSGKANPDDNFRFDPTLGSTGGYIFNLSTKSLTTGTYNLNFKVGNDPITYQVLFQVK